MGNEALERFTSQMQELEKRCERDRKKIGEMIAEGLEKGKIVEIVFFEGIRRDGSPELPFYCANSETKENKGESARGIVRVVDRSQRYIRIEIMNGKEKNQDVDVYGSAVHSYKINHRQYAQGSS